MEKIIIMNFPSNYTMGDIDKIKNILPDILLFNDNFKEKLEIFDLPDSIFYLDLGDTFNNSLDNVILPKYLKKIKFGQQFNQSLEFANLPESLETLEFSDYSCSLFCVKLPEFLKEIIFTKFNSAVPFFLPPHIKKLRFGADYNFSTNSFIIPHKLKSLQISGSVHNKILFDNLPQSLKNLEIIGLDFPVHNLPINLKHLRIDKIDKSKYAECLIKNLSENLESLELIDLNFEINIQHSKLKKMSLINYNFSNFKIILPQDLICLQINGNICNQNLINNLPENLELLEITDILEFEMTNLPISIKELFINTKHLTQNIIQSNLPFLLEKLKISETYQYLNSIVKLPFNCQLIDENNQLLFNP